MPDIFGAGVPAVGLFLVALAGVVAVSLLTGGINTRHLFYGRRSNGRPYFSPERIQLLAVTVWVAFNYLMTVLNNPTVLPDVPQETIALLGGSHLLYLSGKAASRLLPTNSN